jgi:hypothetical protein
LNFSICVSIRQKLKSITYVKLMEHRVDLIGPLLSR